jgi:hypothetical protein
MRFWEKFFRRLEKPVKYAVAPPIIAGEIRESIYEKLRARMKGCRPDSRSGPSKDRAG